jgi:hypothetical protein
MANNNSERFEEELENAMRKEFGPAQPAKQIVTGPNESFEDGFRRGFKLPLFGLILGYLFNFDRTTNSLDDFVVTWQYVYRGMKEVISFDKDPRSLMELLRKVYTVTSDPEVLNALGALESQHPPNSVLSPSTAMESYNKAFQNSWSNTPSLPMDYVFELPAAVQLASANSSAQRYSYYDISKDSIRLLRIKDNDVMDFELTTHEFSKAPEYFALSYV